MVRMRVGFFKGTGHWRETNIARLRTAHVVDFCALIASDIHTFGASWDAWIAEAYRLDVGQPFVGRKGRIG
jgi:hypothetical protein